MTVGRTAALAYVLTLSLALAGCGGDKQEGAPEARKGKPTTKVKHDRRPEARGRGAKRTDEELFTARIESLQGEVKVRERNEAPFTGAVKGSVAYGGGEIVTGQGGTATVSIREVGTLTLDEGTLLVIPRYAECGAILVAGTALLEGSRRAPPRQRCFVHTPSTAVWSQRNRALIAVARDGKTAFGTIEGASTYTDLLGNHAELASGKRLVFDDTGAAGGETKLNPGDGPPEQALRPWLAEKAEGPGKADPWAKQMLDTASRISKRLELDVERLVELMELNRKASEERKSLDATDTDQAGRLEQLTKELTEQAAEMTDLQVKGILQIDRISAVLELVRRESENGSKAHERIAELEQKLAQLAEKLPPLFEKKTKTRSKAGPQLKLDPIGPPPKQPK